MRDTLTTAIDLTYTGDLSAAIGALTPSPVPVATLSAAVDFLRLSLLPSQGRSLASGVETVVLLIASPSHGQSSALSSSVQSLKAATGASVASLLLPTSGGVMPSAPLQEFFRSLDSLPVTQHAFVAQSIPEVAAAAFADNVVNALACYNAITAFDLNLGAGTLHLTFSRSVLPSAFVASALKLVDPDTPSALPQYTLRLASAPIWPDNSTARRRELLLALPPADVASLLSQERLAQRADTVLLLAGAGALRVAGQNVLLPLTAADNVRATALTGPLRPFGVRDLLPVGSTSRTLQVSPQLPTDPNGALTNSSVLCQGLVDSSTATG